MEDMDEFKKLNVTIAKVSCDGNTMCHDFEIDGVPTI